MKNQRIAVVFLIPILTTILLLTGCFLYAEYVNSRPLRPQPGTEQTYYGIVSDHAMSVVDYNTWPQVSRPYIGIQFENGDGELFWCTSGADQSEARIGDFVQIESAIDNRTDLLIATEIIVLEKGR